jgi:hypothetical protein
MKSNREIKQIILENRNIKANITDEGGEVRIVVPVFAWALYDDNTLQPLFIEKDYQIDENPYDIEVIKKVSKKDLGIVSYNWK